MKKNIVTITENCAGEVIDKTADYIGVESFAKTIETLYRECLENYEDGGEFELYINDLFETDYIRTTAFEFAVKTNEEMKKYLHMDSHRMCGNFADIERDYPRYRTGVWWSSEYAGNDYFDLFPEMVKRLDAAEDSELADDDREYLSQWYFSAFGTYNIQYNFANDLEELHRCLEEDYADAV